MQGCKLMPLGQCFCRGLGWAQSHAFELHQVASRLACTQHSERLITRQLPLHPIIAPIHPSPLRASGCAVTAPTLPDHIFGGLAGYQPGGYMPNTYLQQGLQGQAYGQPAAQAGWTANPYAALVRDPHAGRGGRGGRRY